MTGMGSLPVLKDVHRNSTRPPDAFVDRATRTISPITVAPLRIFAPRSSGTSCMTVAEIFCPALLFAEDIDEFSWTGIIVPGGIVSPPSAAIGRAAAVRANARTKVLRGFHVRDCICGESLHMGTIQRELSRRRRRFSRSGALAVKRTRKVGTTSPRGLKKKPHPGGVAGRQGASPRLSRSTRECSNGPR